MRSAVSFNVGKYVVTLSIIFVLNEYLMLQAHRELASSPSSALFNAPVTLFQRQPRNQDKLKIAVLTGFVTRDHNKSRISNGLMDHMVNKACYADLWGYDYIFNETWGFDQNVGARYWLEYGMWHRVPHIKAALEEGYDWVLYADNDWIVQV